MTDEAIEKQSLVKQEYLTNFFRKYADIMEFINTLPIHHQFKQNAITRGDEFMFWVREGIVQIQTLTPEPSISEPELL